MRTNHIKDTKGKTRLDLIPYEALEAIARTRAFGADKYGAEWAWYDNGTTEDFVTAALRHLYKWNDARRLDNRTETDEESGLSHLDHAICSLAMAIAIENRPESRVEIPFKNNTPDINIKEKKNQYLEIYEALGFTVYYTFLGSEDTINIVFSSPKNGSVYHVSISKLLYTNNDLSSFKNCLKEEDWLTPGLFITSIKEVDN